MKLFALFFVTCFINSVLSVRKEYDGLCIDESHTDAPVLDFKEFHTGVKRGLDYLTFSYETKLICETKRYCALMYFTLEYDDTILCPYSGFNKVVCSEENEVLLRRTESISQESPILKAENVTLGLEIYHNCDENDTVRKSVVFLVGQKATECNFYQFKINLTEDGSADFEEKQSLRFQYQEELRFLRAETDLLNGDKFTEDDMDTLLNDSSRYTTVGFQDCFLDQARSYYGFTSY